MRRVALSAVTDDTPTSSKRISRIDSTNSSVVASIDAWVWYTFWPCRRTGSFYTCTVHGVRQAPHCPRIKPPHYSRRIMWELERALCHEIRTPSSRTDFDITNFFGTLRRCSSGKPGFTVRFEEVEFAWRDWELFQQTILTRFNLISIIEKLTGMFQETAGDRNRTKWDTWLGDTNYSNRPKCCCSCWCPICKTFKWMALDRYLYVRVDRVL